MYGSMYYVCMYVCMYFEMFGIFYYFSYNQVSYRGRLFNPFTEEGIFLSCRNTLCAGLSRNICPARANNKSGIHYLYIYR